MENNDWDEIKKYSEKYEKENIDKYGINLNEQLDKIIQKKNNNKDKYKKKSNKNIIKNSFNYYFHNNITSIFISSISGNNGCCTWI